MARKPAPLLLALVAILCLAGEAAARNLESSLFSVGVLGGRGGSFDLEPDPGLSNPAWLVYAGMATDLQTQVSLRLGRLEFDEDAGFGDLEKADLEFALLAGEYRFPKSWYDVGVYLGLGGYRVSGRDVLGAEVDESGLGVAFGITGDYRLWRSLFLTAEINGHYVFIDRANLFGTALVGLGLRF